MASKPRIVAVALDPETAAYLKTLDDTQRRTAFVLLQRYGVQRAVHLTLEQRPAFVEELKRILAGKQQHPNESDLTVEERPK